MNKPVALLNLISSDGYEVLREYVEDERMALIQEMEDADPADGPKVLAAQAVLHGFSIGWKNIVSRIEQELAVYRAQVTQQAPNEAAQEIERTLSPFGTSD